MPMLTSLSLRLDFAEGDKPLMCARVNITHSPGLRVLRLFDQFDLEVGGKQIHTSIDACNLHLPGDFPPSRRCLHFLTIAPNLKRFQVTFNRANSQSSSHSNERCDVVLHDLSCLKLGGEKVFALVLDSLTLPRLKYLDLHCNESHQDPIARANLLLGFVQRSMPLLIYLDIRAFSMNEDTLIPLLRLLPALKCVVLPTFGVSTRLLQALAVSLDLGTGEARSAGGGCVLCPELHNLYFWGLCFLGSVDVSVDALIDMLQSRCILKTFRRVLCTNGIRCDISSIQERSDELRQHVQHLMLVDSGDEEFLNFPDV